MKNNILLLTLLNLTFVICTMDDQKAFKSPIKFGNSAFSRPVHKKRSEKNIDQEIADIITNFTPSLIDSDRDTATTSRASTITSNISEYHRPSVLCLPKEGKFGVVIKQREDIFANKNQITIPSLEKRTLNSDVHEITAALMSGAVKKNRSNREED
ncbi:MAG: hypothetical protein JO129_04045 [Candidatus Dependentiae bacterium]|nr:hypothetical protein [Candidatus Dependentiae bacterium]